MNLSSLSMVTEPLADFKDNLLFVEGVNMDGSANHFAVRSMFTGHPIASYNDPDPTAKSIDQVIADHGHIDVLVANAGVGFVRSTEQATEAEVQWVMDVNFMGLVRCTKAVLPHMRTARGGRVIAVSSIGGLAGQPFNEIYCASKFAVEGFTESLAAYVGHSFNIHFSFPKYNIKRSKNCRKCPSNYISNS